ncbi:hypothetical protein TL16_g09407 [Triparma laevis f. inornata]|uniref:Uncharacterized protein n=1 Tax=Triparma laevis f. inornata TaxID=1714386 RepID=A0A9W7EJ54_9STRA|nr:hypothetical protein TL16_g09407 [Triparma laevis f. inornata]
MGIDNYGSTVCSTSHYVCPPDTTSAAARNELVFFLGGTGYEPPSEELIPFYLHAQSLGFHVVSPCYDNLDRSIEHDCGDSSDPMCFENERNEKMYDAGGIIPRTLDLLQTLADGDGDHSGEGWTEFLSSDSSAIVSSKAVVSGHSQGAGFAAFWAKAQVRNCTALLSPPPIPNTARFASPLAANRRSSSE